MVVAELFAKLGLQVDAGSFKAVNAGVQSVAVGASRAVTSLKGVTAAAKEAASAAANAGRWMDPGGRWRENNGRFVKGGAAAVAAGNGGVLPPIGGGGGQAAGAAGPTPPQPPGGGFKQWISQLNAAKVAAAGFASAFAGSFVVTQLREFTHEIVELSGQLVGISERTGLSTTAIQELGFAAQIAEADVGALETGLKFLAMNSAQAAAGSKGDAKAFRDIGVNVKDSAGNVKSADVLLSEAADGIMALGSDAERTAAAVAVFGRSGAQLLPLMKRGSSGIAELRAEARRLGGGLEHDVIEQADEFEDQMFKVDFAMRAVKSTLAGVLLPVLQGLAHALTDTVAWFKHAAKHTYFLQSALAVGLGVALVKVIPLIQALTLAQLRAAGTALLAAAPVLLWAAGLIALTLAIDDLYNLIKGNKSAIGEWIDEWAGIGTVDQFVKSWSQGIDSLATAFGDALGAMGNFLEVAGAISKLLSNPLDTANWSKASDAAMKALGSVKSAAGEIVTGASAYVTAVSGDQPEAVNRAEGRGMDAAAIADESTPRAVARGINAGRKLGSAGFGQAARSSSALNGGAPAVQQQNNTTIHTGADEHTVRKVVQEEHGKANRRLKAALAPKSNG